MSKVSSILTPFRWYNQYHDQNRWDNDCNSVCEFKLITDKYHLLPFQFKRDKDIFTITDFVLRKCCNDPKIKVLGPVDTNFVSSSTNWVDVNTIDINAWNVNCNGGVCANVGGGEKNETRLEWSGLTIGKTYTYNIVISSLSTVSGPLVFYCGATTILSVTSPGIYTGSFTALATTMNFAYPLITDASDIYCIQYIQLEEAFEVTEDDVVLDPLMIKYFNSGDYDYFIYCGDDIRSFSEAKVIPPGCYYGILQDENGNLYYSEVITVEDFVPEKSPYLLLEWYNTCDIKDVIYHTITIEDSSCSYKNKLWLSESVLSRPTYPFKEEGEEDGNQTFNATFQKLDKTITLLAAKVPEYIIDSLNGVRLHDTIQFYRALRKKQEVIDPATKVVSVEADTQFIFNDCFGNVELKCLLDEKFVDETCCSDITPRECVGCSEAGDLNTFDSDVYEFALILESENPDQVLGLFQYNGSDWVLLTPEEVAALPYPLVCTHDSGQYEYQPENPNQVGTTGWVSVPQLVSLTYVSGSTFNVVGSVHSKSFAILEYSIDGGTNWVATTPKKTWEEIQTSTPVVFPGVPCCGNFIARIRSTDLNGCDYGTSEELTVSSPTNDCC